MSTTSGKGHLMVYHYILGKAIVHVEHLFCEIGMYSIKMVGRK